VDTPEQQACRAWAAAFDPVNVEAANEAAAIAPKTPAGQLMNVFLAASGLPGASSDPQRPVYLMQVRERCADAGVEFAYPA
jgi:hypothetical protein